METTRTATYTLSIFLSPLMEYLAAQMARRLLLNYINCNTLLTLSIFLSPLMEYLAARMAHRLLLNYINCITLLTLSIFLSPLMEYLAARMARRLLLNNAFKSSSDFSSPESAQRVGKRDTNSEPMP